MWTVLAGVLVGLTWLSSFGSGLLWAACGVGLTVVAAGLAGLVAWNIPDPPDTSEEK